MRFTPSLSHRLADPPSEASRANMEQQIRELQTHAVATQTTGRYLGRQTLVGIGTYVPSIGTKRVRIRGAACGGGGGGADTGSGGGGGASGAFIDTELLTSDGKDIVGGPYSAPTSGGAGGAIGGGNGATGSNATMSVNGIAITLKGGLPGQGMAAGGDGAAQGGGTQTGSSAGAVQSPGEPSIRWSGGAAWLPGSGGQTILSAEARAISPPEGPDGGGFGAGGAGGYGSGVAGSPGGAGAGAGFLLEEFS